MGIMKMTSLVTCLCCLHNYCINKCLIAAGIEEVPTSLVASDTLEIMAHGGVALEATVDNAVSPEELLHGGSSQ
jgi:hypothetical protein